VRKTFGDKLVDDLLAASPDAVIYDTRAHGKPDMVKMTLKLVKEFNAEAVYVVSSRNSALLLIDVVFTKGVSSRIRSSHARLCTE
jgi:hypothetical protein